MKQKDIALIVIVVFFSGVISILLSNTFISSGKNRQIEVEKVEAISPAFNEPDSRYFNKESINPTRIISIDKNNNTEPFRN